MFAYLFLHWVPEKAIYVGGHTLPWDARCAGIYLGFGLALAWTLVGGSKKVIISRLPILALNTIMLVPLCLDVLSLILKLRYPSNEIRYLTGIFFGSALCIYLYSALIILIFKNNQRDSLLHSYLSYSLFISLQITVFFFIKLHSSYAYWATLSLAIFGFAALYIILIINCVIVIFRFSRMKTFG